MRLTSVNAHRKAASEVRAISLNFEPALDSGELLTGTPTITASPASGAPTFASVARNSVAKTIEGVSVIASQAVQGVVSGGTAGTTYTLTWTATTDGGQTIIRYTVLQVDNS